MPVSENDSKLEVSVEALRNIVAGNVRLELIVNYLRELSMHPKELPEDKQCNYIATFALCVQAMKATSEEKEEVLNQLIAEKGRCLNKMENDNKCLGRKNAQILGWKREINEKEQVIAELKESLTEKEAIILGMNGDIDVTDQF
ncbi:hypothetical protein APHAL10511_003790 [Amanita phalloides]|nr:hypothetical protein APHAL10511_003790 [Amanita phalloides]